MLRLLARELFGCALLGGLAALAACTSLTGSSVASTTVSTYSPVTSIEIDANQLFERIGCGPGAGQAFRYAVAVYAAQPSGARILGANGADPDPLGMSVTDCYTDAVFENLSTNTIFGGTSYFSLSVYVFDQPTYDASFEAIEKNADANAGTWIAANAKNEAQIAQLSATCTARQEPNIEALAACDPLQ